MRTLQLIGGLTFVALVVVWMSYFTVSPSEVGVIVRFGKIESTVGSGFHLKIPFVESVESFPTSLQSFTMDKINTYTVDNQEVDVTFTVVYKVDVSQAAQILQNLPDYQTRLQTLAVDRFKSEAGKVSTTDIAAKRGDLAKATLDRIHADAKSLFNLDVIDFQINNFDYTPAFRQAVDQAAIAKTKVAQAEQQRDQATVDADRIKIAAIGNANSVREAARGDADSKLLIATAQAQATKLAGDAEASAIQAKAQALKANDELVEFEKAQRWNGQLPTNMYGSAPIPFLNLTNQK